MNEKLFKPMDNPPIENVSDIIQQAKELEKQHIIDAYDLGMGHYGGVNRRSDAEQYYKETYEK